jgi:hypothetical protein
MAKQADPNALTLFDFTKHPTNYQPNILTQSRQEFTELEKKIVVLVVNQIGHMSLKGQIVAGQNVLFTIPFTELTRVRYDQIGAAAESLQLKRLGYRNDQDEKFDYIVPFPRIRSLMQEGKKVIELTMFADIVPYFAELGQRYTKYDIDVMLSLSSVYAQRIFEIVSMYYHRGQRQFTYEVEELRLLLNVPDSYSFNDFRKNVLLVAQRELEQKARLLLDWQPARKEGKRIMALAFTIKTTQQLAQEGVESDRQYTSKLPIHEAIQAAYQLMAAYKLKPWQKDLIISDLDRLETFFRVDAELANGLRPAVLNPTAYLVKSLGIERKPVDTPPASSSTGVTNPVTTDPVQAGRSGQTQSMNNILSSLFPELGITENP